MGQTVYSNDQYNKWDAVKSVDLSGSKGANELSNTILHSFYVNFNVILYCHFLLNHSSPFNLLILTIGSNIFVQVSV